MTVSNAKADDYFASKQIVPTDLRSAEMSYLSRQLRERAFWSSGVEDARILSGIYSAVAEVVAGNYSPSEARVKINDILARNGYSPKAGTESSIKDLRSFSRQQVVLQISAEAARGYSQYIEAQEMLEYYPCQELVRARRAIRPRDWKSRWIAAGGKLASGGRMIAQVNDPIWSKISAFGMPYPPFDYNSGMVIEPIDMEEAIEAGAISKNAKILTDATPPSINENLEAKIEAQDDLWNKMLDEFGGFARREGDTLMFTDPNGTKQYPTAELIGVLSERLPNIYKDRHQGKYPNLQVEALTDWAVDPVRFRKTPWSDEAQDMRRLIDRVEPMKEPGTLYRGMNWKSGDSAEAKAFFESVDEGAISVSNPFESFSKNQFVAARYTSTASAKRGVLIEVEGAKSAKDLTPLIDHFCKDYQFHENEVMFSRGAKFKILEKHDYKDGDTLVTHLRVEELS